ncbi:MAG: PqqD family protein [Clostridia bacterium]|nr:PqqD family protein [Clostridia bacterium]
MKRNENFIMQELAGQFVLVPFGEHALDFNGIVTLNETAKFLWESSAEEINPEKLTAALIKKYSVDEKTAETAVNAFIEQLKEAGCIDG